MISYLLKFFIFSFYFKFATLFPFNPHPNSTTTYFPLDTASDNYILKGLKDGSLKPLAKYLNENKKFFLKWNTNDMMEDSYLEFFELLKPWILSDFHFQLKSISKPIYRLNCKDRKYISVLKGTVLQVPRLIVDFIPFGYDVDKLLIRLYETFDYVDVFVIYESTRTQSGMPKPLYFNLLKNDSRFTQFQHKIIHLISDDNDLSTVLRQTKSSLEKIRKGEKADKNELWALEYSMRTEMITKFTKLASSNSILQELLSNNMTNALGIQNDADEIISGKVLYHLRNCEIRSDVKGIFTPAFFFKRNVHWLEHTKDLECLKLPALKSYLWRPGPYLWPLQMMLDKMDTMRYIYTDDFQCKYHMGIGAAVHLSSITDPVEGWLKQCGVIEKNCSNVLSSEFINAGRNGSITPTLILTSSTQVSCRKYRYQNAYVPKLSETARIVVEQSVPWIIRQNPNSFPFLIPEKTSSDNIGGIIKKFNRLDLNEICGKIL